MKSNLKFLVIILIISSCNQSVKQKTSSTNDTTNISNVDSVKHYDITDFEFNKSKFKIDTSINDVLIGDKTFSFIALREKDKNNATDDGGIPYGVTFVFIDPATNKAIISKQIDLLKEPANGYSIFKTNTLKLNEKGDLYITASLIAGGSGGRQGLYYVNLKNGKIIFNKLFEYEIGMHSTTEVYFNKTKSEILKIDGIASTVDADSGDYYSEKCSIEKYDNINGEYKKSTLGLTRYRYNFSDDSDDGGKNVWNQIKSKETDLLKSINISDFKN